MVRIILLTLVLYTGPANTAEQAGVITVTIPAALAANPPICTIG